MSSAEFISKNSDAANSVILKQRKIIDGGVVVYYSVTQGEMNIEGIGFPVIKKDKISVGLITFGHSANRHKETQFHIKHQSFIADEIAKQFEASIFAIPASKMKTRQELEDYLKTKIENTQNSFKV